jgi:hypothetical protein
MGFLVPNNMGGLGARIAPPSKTINLKYVFRKKKKKDQRLVGNHHLFLEVV